MACLNTLPGIPLSFTGVFLILMSVVLLWSQYPSGHSSVFHPSGAEADKRGIGYSSQYPSGHSSVFHWWTQAWQLCVSAESQYPSGHSSVFHCHSNSSSYLLARRANNFLHPIVTPLRTPVTRAH